jgi:predicted nucleic acid-binding protein
MICADTSIWIECFRGSKEIIQEMVSRLDDGEIYIPIPVWFEVLVGADRKSAQNLKSQLSALPKLYPNRNTWGTIQAWVEIARRKGQRFGFADLLIAAITKENDCILWTLDEDFQRMSALKFLKLMEV